MASCLTRTSLLIICLFFFSFLYAVFLLSCFSYYCWLLFNHGISNQVRAACWFFLVFLLLFEMMIRIRRTDMLFFGYNNLKIKYTNDINQIHIWLDWNIDLVFNKDKEKKRKENMRTIWCFGWLVSKAIIFNLLWCWIQ